MTTGDPGRTSSFLVLNSGCSLCDALGVEPGSTQFASPLLSGVPALVLAGGQGVQGLRFLLRRNWEHLTMGQRETIWALETANRRTFRAFSLLELRDIFALPLIQARRALDDWLHYASRSKLTPFVRLARTIRNYRASIEATIEWRLTNGIAESNNASIARIRTNARWFHDPHAVITTILLDRAGIGPDLPWTTVP